MVKMFLFAPNIYMNPDRATILGPYKQKPEGMDIKKQEKMEFKQQSMG